MRFSVFRCVVKVRASVRRICDKCKLIRAEGRCPRDSAKTPATSNGKANFSQGQV